MRSRALMRAARRAAAHGGGRWPFSNFFFVFNFKIRDLIQLWHKVLKDPSLCSDTTVGIAVADPDPAAVDRQSGPRPEARFLRQPVLEGLTRSARTKTPRNGDRNKSDQRAAAAGGGGVGLWRRRGGRERALGFRFPCGNLESSTCVTLNGSGIQLAVSPQPLWLRNHNFGLAQPIMVKRLATSRHDPLGITDSACKNQLVVVSVQYGPFNPYIPIRSTTIGKSRVAKDPIAMNTSWRSNSGIASVTSIGYPRMQASGESSTTKHRLLHASGSHPIPPPNDSKYKFTELKFSKGCDAIIEESSKSIKPANVLNDKGQKRTRSEASWYRDISELDEEKCSTSVASWNYSRGDPSWFTSLEQEHVQIGVEKQYSVMKKQPTGRD
ncbi:carbonic anhydrase [Dorcoceras hygrometricum]|uniref:Carbonic anhydrase n=1 Tax=Dorcoceras hygrometricum TaxID=472368 RepID=A0A2Z7D450_9LAMI|nr:carbonic anhydrase [Dorcoceras hygrometricum]